MRNMLSILGFSLLAASAINCVYADEQMVSIAAGTFQMGSDDARQSQPLHAVSIKAFALGKYPVTRGEFEKFINETGYDAGKGWRKPLFKQGDNDPVVNASWDDAHAYIEWLNKKFGKNYRLPTEAEWEYAARAGTKTAYYWGEKIESAHANCSDCGSQWDNDKTAPIGSFTANSWGLFDMSGNAAQWVQDCFAETYDGAPTDGSAMTGGDCKYRVIRGGGWNDSPKAVRVDTRDFNLPGFRYSNVGFRLARDL